MKRLTLTTACLLATIAVGSSWAEASPIKRGAGRAGQRPTAAGRFRAAPARPATSARQGAFRPRSRLDGVDGEKSLRSVGRGSHRSFLGLDGVDGEKPQLGAQRGA
jgi:hypothetical protein